MGEEDSPDLETVAFVGPATADRLAPTDIDATDITSRRVTHADLIAADVNPGVAARLRRRHSLPWSRSADADDLDRRATNIRGLDGDEQAWVAASAGDWTDTLDRELPTAEDPEPPSREPDRDPVTVIDGIGPTRAGTLADAGITSVRALAIVDPETVASTLDLAESRVRRWRESARKRQE